MGNKLARTTQVSPSEYYLHDLPSSYNLVLKEALGGGRFLKSIQCVHDEGLLLVKVYFKRGEFINLKEYEKKLYEIREKLKDIQHSHVWPFQYWLETDKAAYLLRQYFFSNLHDRISTRPFLSVIEKKWLAFQLLHALKQIHERGICHGDIKCENVLVTSWNWVYLADFYGSLKPTYLPVDNPADFSFFFDTGGRRRCYLAPEVWCQVLF
jgi:phosphoinositide-3-kinase regulatory subunit 4